MCNKLDELAMHLCILLVLVVVRVASVLRSGGHCKLYSGTLENSPRLNIPV